MVCNALCCSCSNRLHTARVARLSGTGDRSRPHSQHTFGMAPGPRKPELVSLQPSPWSLKARWTLKHHHIEYKTIPYTFGVGEVYLRLRLWKFFGRVSTPVLFPVDGDPVTDSFDIALWADKHGIDTSTDILVPTDKLWAIQLWNERCDAVLFYARAALIVRLTSDKEALRSYLPKSLQRLGSFGLWIGKLAVGRLEKKYSRESASTSLNKAREALLALRQQLKESGGQYILGAFSYADILMCIATITIEPLAPPYVSKLSAVRRQMEEFADFSDLVSWRMSVMEKHLLPLLRGRSA